MNSLKVPKSSIFKKELCATITCKKNLSIPSYPFASMSGSLKSLLIFLYFAILFRHYIFGFRPVNCLYEISGQKMPITSESRDRIQDLYNVVAVQLATREKKHFKGQLQTIYNN